jgi:sulfhydrogenase subunit alpha
MTKSIVVDEVCRVEGHGGINVSIQNGKLSKVDFDIFEGTRFFEPLLKGRPYDEVASITSRICAICSFGHTLASLQATEDAFGVKVSAQTEKLRDLMMHGEMIESHALHLFCLVLPDLLGYPSAIHMAADHKDAVVLGLGLKKLGNTIREVLGGRAIHPCNAVVGGFGKLPSLEQLVAAKGSLVKALDDAMTAIDLLASLPTPDFSESPTVYAALDSPGGIHGYFGKDILISTGERLDIHDYRKLTNERTVSHSHAKHSLYAGKPYMTGSLARLILNEGKLKGKAVEAKQKLGLTLPTDNIFANNLAQAVELVFSIERSREIIEELAREGMREEGLPEVKVKAGQGTGAVEVPRGTLYHSYTYDDGGRVLEADIITPTAQNLANIEKDFRAALEHLPNEPQDQMAFKLEMVARAYDPCISCSVHLIEIDEADARKDGKGLRLKAL